MLLFRIIDNMYKTLNVTDQYSNTDYLNNILIFSLETLS